MLAGAFLPALAPFASGIGGFLGGLFDKKKKDDQKGAAPIVKGLDAVEHAPRDTITTIEKSTQALLSPESRFLNLPADFTIPNVAPGFGSGSPTVTSGDVHNNVSLTLNVNGANQSPEQMRQIVADALRDSLGDFTYHERRNRSRT